MTERLMFAIVRLANEGSEQTLHPVMMQHFDLGLHETERLLEAEGLTFRREMMTWGGCNKLVSEPAEPVELVVALVPVAGVAKHQVSALRDGARHQSLGLRVHLLERRLDRTERPHPPRERLHRLVVREDVVIARAPDVAGEVLDGTVDADGHVERTDIRATQGRTTGQDGDSHPPPPNSLAHRKSRVRWFRFIHWFPMNGIEASGLGSTFHS